MPYEINHLEDDLYDWWMTKGTCLIKGFYGRSMGSQDSNISKTLIRLCGCGLI